jgi:hypothetical protein
MSSYDADACVYMLNDARAIVSDLTDLKDLLEIFELVGVLTDANKEYKKQTFKYIAMVEKNLNIIDSFESMSFEPLLGEKESFEMQFQGHLLERERKYIALKVCTSRAKEFFRYAKKDIC